MKPTKEQLQAWGRAGGVARSAAKSKASRRNGKMGGRPKKIVSCYAPHMISVQGS